MKRDNWDVRAGFALAFLLALAAPALAQAPNEPACGTDAAPKWCASLTSGAASVITREARREYVTGGLEVAGPLGAGFSFAASADAWAVQDGAAADSGIEKAFRVVYLEADVARMTGPLQLQAHAALTYSIEGQIGAPVDPRQFEALIEARYLVGGGHVALRGGHDGAVGGWSVGADIDIPVGAGKPALVARYEFPLGAVVVGQPRPWVATVGARVHLASFRLGK